MRRFLLGLGVTCALLVAMITPAHSQSVGFAQGENRAGGQYANGDVHWIGGILQGNNSELTEGMSTLQRLIIGSIPTNGTHTVTFQVQASKSGHHAYDFLTSWDQAVSYANTLASDLYVSLNPCGDQIQNADLIACNAAHAGTFTWAALNPSTPLTDPGTAAGTGVDAARQAYFTTYPSPGDGVVKIWGSEPITNASLNFLGYSADQSQGGGQLAEYSITFTSNADYVVMEWGGHLAIGVGGYGVNNGAGAISGGPYHFKLENVDGQNGSQDNQIQAGTVIIPPTCAMTGPTTACPSTPSLVYNANADTQNGAVTYSWAMTNNTAGAQFSGGVTNPATASVTVVPTGTTFTPGGHFNLSVTVTRGGISHTCYLNSDVSPGDLVVINNLNAAPTATPSNIQLATSTTSQLHANPTGGSGTYTYTWSADPANGSLSSHSIENPVFTTTHTGTYDYTVTVNDGQCTVTKPVRITASLNGANPCQVPNHADVCAGTNNVQFTATWDNPGGYHTVWTVQSGNGTLSAPSVDGSLTQNINVGAGPSTVVVRFSWASPTGLDAGFCEGQVNVVAYPTGNRASISHCSNTGTSTFDLTSVNSTIVGSQTGLTVTFYTDFALTQPINTPTAYTAPTSTVFAKVANSTGCAVPAQVDLYVYQNPILTLHNPAAVCAPNTVDLTASAVTAGSTIPTGSTISYWLDAAATQAVPDPTAVGAGTYYIKAVASGPLACSDIQPVTVTVNPTPALVTHNPAPVCAPSTVDLTAAAVTSGSTLPTGTTLTYWTDAAATQALATPSTVTASGTYYIKAAAGTCTDIKPVTVTVNPTPSLTVHNPAAVCSPTTVDLTAAAVTAGSTLPTGTTLTYWTDAAATQALANPNAVTTSGTYYIKATTTSNCFDIKPVTVTVNPTPSLTVHNPSPVCAPSTVDLTTSAVTSGSTLPAGTTLSYWTDAAATQALANPNAVSASGTYYIKATAGTCTDIKPVTVTVNPSPSLTITDPTPICSPTTIDLTAPAITAGSTLPTGTTLSYWSDAAATVAIADPTMVSTAGTYYVKATSPGSCTDIKPVHVAFLTCGSNFYTVTQGKLGNLGGLACTPDGPLTTVQLYQYTINKTTNKVLVIGSNGRDFRVRMDATQDDPTSTTDVPAGTATADILGTIAAMPAGGKSAILPTGTVYGASIPSTWLKNGRFNNVMIGQTIALSVNINIAGNLAGFELKSGRDLYSVKRAPGSSCTGTTAMTCLQGNPYTNVGQLNSAVVSYLQSVALAGTPTDGKAYVSELLALANMALGNQLPVYPNLTLDAIQSVENQINNVFDQGAIFVDYGNPSAPTCPTFLTTNTLNSITVGTIRDGQGSAATTLATKFEVSAYPNPARGQVSFKILAPTSGNAMIQLFSMDGKKIYEAKKDVFAGQTIEPVTLKAAGMIMYRVTLNNQVFSGKFTSLE